MTHHRDCDPEAPLDRFQDVSPEQDTYSASSDEQDLKQLPPWTRSDSKTDTASTTSVRDDVDHKHITTMTGSDVSYPQHQGPQLPELSQVTSSGAAAPYFAPALGLWRPTYSRQVSALSEKTLKQVPTQITLSRVSTDAQGYTYPEGGAEAWLCVFGSFCGMMSALGIMNSIGTIHTYISEHQLRGTSESTIGWIFGIYTFLAFFCGIQVGPLFDAKGPRWLILSGSILVLITWFTLGLCTQYWHFIVIFSICGGVGTSLIFTPAVTAVGHFFLVRRGLCTGMAAVGGSMGGVVWPLVLQALFPKVGFAWATRIVGFVSIILVIFANLFIRSRLPPRKATKESILPDLRIFRDPVYALTTMGIFFVEWALFIPLTYLTSYALSRGVNSTLAYQIIAFMNVGSCFGRWLPGLVADKFGRFNTMITTIVLSMVTTLAIWLPAGSSVPALIVYAVVFGFASGSGISLTPVCVSQLCKVENYGRYYATCYTVVSFACLTGIPIAGALITSAGGSYQGVIIFTGCSYAAAMASFIAARVLGAGWGLTKVY